MKVDDIHLKSEEVQEILGTPPSSIVRWGVTVVFLIVTMLLFMSYYIKYPDIIKGKTIITTKNPPVQISSFASGVISEIYVNDKDSVYENQDLALVGSTAKYFDVLSIESLISELDTATNISQIVFENKRKSMGEIQSEYNYFISSYNALTFFYNNNIEAKTNHSIKSQIYQLSNQKNKLIKQKYFLNKELEIFQNQLDQQKKLLDNNIISKQDYETLKLKSIQKKQQLEQFNINISNNNISQNNLRTTIENNSYSRDYKDNEIVMKFEESKDLLISKINWWKKKYMIIAPMSGNISFSDKVNKNQKILPSDQIFTIIPKQNEIIAKILVPLYSISKIKEDQKILIELLSYPAPEFGYLESKIKSISLIPNSENQYQLEAILPSELITSFNKKIEFKTEMLGTSSIITSKKRISDRLFEKFRDLADMK